MRKGKQNEYNQGLVHCGGWVCSRIEFSFYGDILKNPQVYKDVIAEFFPRKYKYLSTYKCFNQVNIEHYWEKLFEGEKKYGRVIYIEELLNG